jgi:hypothetical protein
VLVVKPLFGLAAFLEAGQGFSEKEQFRENLVRAATSSGSIL